MKKKKMSRTKYQEHLKRETEHRKKWLDKPIKTRRYIRGTVKGKLDEKLHSRKGGHETGDPIIRAKVLAKTGGMCYLCGRIYNPVFAKLLPHLYFSYLQIDHIHPLSKYGPNNIGNYLPSCDRCNRIKSNLGMIEARERIADDIERRGY